MSFLSDIIEDVFEGVLSDLEFTESSTYVSLTASSYNTATSEVSNTESTATVTAVYYNQKDSLALLAKLAPRGGVNTTQTLDTVEANLPAVKAVIPAKQLVDASITPKTNDLLRRGATEYTIESIEEDPAQAAYIFTLRQP